MKKIIILIFALVSCSKQNADPLVVSHDLALKNSSSGQLEFQFGDSSQPLTRNLQYSKGEFTLDGPITVPADFSGALGIHFPDSYHVFTNASFSSKNDKSLLLPQETTQTASFSVTNLAQFFSENQSTEGVLQLFNSDQIALSIKLRTPPAGLEVNVVDGGEGAPESLEAGSLELLLLKTVTIKNPLSAAVEVSYTPLLEGTLHQERTQFNISYILENMCEGIGKGSQIDLSASLNLNLHLFEVSDELPNTFYRDIDSVQKKVLVLAPGEQKNFGIYGVKGSVEGFKDHSDAQSKPVKTNPRKVCLTKVFGISASCSCGGYDLSGLPIGNSSKRSTLTLNNNFGVFALRYADMSRDQDPNDRNFTWVSGAFSVFQP